MEDQEEQSLVADSEVDIQQEVTGSDENEVMQVIVQEDGQIIMPEGQLLQVNSDGGHPQFIQLTGEDGQNQLLQLMPDGRAQLIQVITDQGGSQIIQVAQPDDLNQDVTENGEAIDAGQMEEAMMLEQGEEGQLQEVSYVSDVNDPVDEMPKADETGEEQEELNQMAMNEETGMIEEPQEGEVMQESHEEAILNTENTTTDETAPETSAGELQEPDQTPIDESNPIAVTSDTVVVIGGKKCVLRVDPASNHLVAYPFVAQGRKRGRPKKTELERVKEEEISEDEDEQRDLSEQENSAAQGLLGLSDSDGVRRSCRVKKKSKVLKEYETGKIDDVDEEEAVEESDDSDSPVKRGRGRPPKYFPTPVKPITPGLPIIQATANTMQTLLASLGYPVKRGRGRPRRNPLPGSMVKPIPAFIIPSSEGRAVMMAPMENVHNTDAIDKATGKVDIVSSGPEHIIIQKADGTQTQLTVKKHSDEVNSENKPEEQDSKTQEENAASKEEEEYKEGKEAKDSKKKKVPTATLR